MKLKKLYGLLLLGIITIMVGACSKDKGNEEPEVPAEEPAGIWPISQVTVLMKNYGLNADQAFFTFPSVDPYNPPVDKLDDYMFSMGGVVGIPLVCTQMVLPELGMENSLYSNYDVKYPVILVSARGGKMKVRCLSRGAGEDFKTLLLNLSVPKENEGFRQMTAEEREFFGYAYEEDGDWQTLDFPENRTDDFRVACMSIIAEYKYNGTLHDSGTSRTWFFVQLPWTDDEEVFDRVPLYSLDDLAK